MVCVGCAALRTGVRSALASEKMTLSSRADDAKLTVSFRTRVFGEAQTGVADFFFTDIPTETLASGGDLSRCSATIVHIHQLVTPSAGDTPIADSATNAIVRVLVLHEGVAGLYAGGGFANPSLGDTTATCGVRGATVRLGAATPGFRDALGASIFSASLSATRDDAAANTIRRAFLAVEATLNRTDPASAPLTRSK